MEFDKNEGKSKMHKESMDTILFRANTRDDIDKLQKALAELTVPITEMVQLVK